MSATSNPRSARSAAVALPDGPAPTTITSQTRRFWITAVESGDPAGMLLRAPASATISDGTTAARELIPASMTHESTDTVSTGCGFHGATGRASQPKPSTTDRLALPAQCHTCQRQLRCAALVASDQERTRQLPPVNDQRAPGFHATRTPCGRTRPRRTGRTRIRRPECPPQAAGWNLHSHCPEEPRTIPCRIAQECHRRSSGS